MVKDWKNPFVREVASAWINVIDSIYCNGGSLELSLPSGQSGSLLFQNDQGDAHTRIWIGWPLLYLHVMFQKIQSADYDSMWHLALS